MREERGTDSQDGFSLPREFVSQIQRIRERNSNSVVALVWTILEPDNPVEHSWYFVSRPFDAAEQEKVEGLLNANLDWNRLVTLFFYDDQQVESFGMLAPYFETYPVAAYSIRDRLTKGLAVKFLDKLKEMEINRK